jgi:hypothetical protein
VPSPADVFQIVPFSNADILGGVLHELTGMSFKNLRKMGSLNAKFGPLVVAEKHGAVVRNLCEVYFLAPFGPDRPADFAKKYGSLDAFSVYFFNDTAIALTVEFGVRLPASVGKITRADMEQLPSGLGTMLYWNTFSAA